MTTGFSHEALDEAEACTKSSQSYQASKDEQALNAFGDKASAISSSQMISASSHVTAVGVSVFKRQLSNVVENSRILVCAFEELGKAPEELVRVTQATEAAISGAWSGTYDYPWRTGSPDGPVSFVITQNNLNGRFRCRGIDRWGPFTANGRVSGARVTFLKEYTDLQGGMKVSWQYNGLLNENRDEVSGHWGTPSPYDDDASGQSLSTGAMPEWRRQGTFVLYRRPVHYLLCRPSEEEFQENKPRALWKLLRNVARYWFQSQFKNLTGEAICERRVKRLTYMGLLERKSERGDSFVSSDDKRTWEELVRTVHPGDLYLWRTIAHYKKLREPVHVNLICDHCAKPDLPSTRIMCIECLEGEVEESIDQCPNCQTGGTYLTKFGKAHTLSHPMIQLRRPLLRRVEINPVLSDAKSRLKALSDKDTNSCKLCKKELSEKPYWCCIECKGEIFVCIECNNRSEKDKPWLLQQNVTPNYIHDSIHTMVLNTQVAVRLSIDQRLAQLETKLDEQVEENRACLKKLEENQGRLMKLEELLERVVNAVAPAT